MTTEIHVNPEALNGTPKRQGRSYQTELLQLQTRVDTALSLLGIVKVEKNSADTMAAVFSLLKGK